jgi:hypothetical protein
MRLLFITSILVLLRTASQAQDVSIDRVDIVASGLYSVKPAGEIVHGENTASGALRPVARQNILKLTTTVPGKMGVKFGVKFIARGKPDGTKMNITFITKYPPQGLYNPDTGKTSYESNLSGPL